MWNLTKNVVSLSYLNYLAIRLQSGKKNIGLLQIENMFTPYLSWLTTKFSSFYRLH